MKTAVLAMLAVGFAAAQPVDAVRGMVAAFQKHPVVIIGEAHWLQRAGDFYIRLVRDPEFQATVQDIVVEFASRNNQALLDRYIGGQEVPAEDVRRIWRDTTKVASWESPIYAAWLAGIRGVNRGLPPARRLRVLAGDTAVDWNRIHAHQDWADLGDNNVSIATVIRDQVLAKKRRALVVLGSNHVTRSGDRDGSANTTTRVEARYRGSTFVALIAFANASQFSGAAPTLHPAPGDKNADAYLYLGPREALTMAMPPAGTLEPAYLTEIDRRSMIEWGELRARKFLGEAGK